MFPLLNALIAAQEELVGMDMDAEEREKAGRRVKKLQEQYKKELTAFNLNSSRRGLPHAPQSLLEVGILGLKALDRLNDNIENIFQSMRAVHSPTICGRYGGYMAHG